MTNYRVLPDVDLAVEDVRDSKGRRITEEYAERAAADALASVGRGSTVADRGADAFAAGHLSGDTGVAGKSQRRSGPAGSTRLRRRPRRPGALPRVLIHTRTLGGAVSPPDHRAFNRAGLLGMRRSRP